MGAVGFSRFSGSFDSALRLIRAADVSGCPKRVLEVSAVPSSFLIRSGSRRISRRKSSSAARTDSEVGTVLDSAARRARARGRLASRVSRAAARKPREPKNLENPENPRT